MLTSKNFFLGLLLSLFCFSSVFATNITNLNVWTHTAVKWDLVYPEACNEVCGWNKWLTDSISAAEWNTCSWDNKSSGDIVTFGDWNELVNKKSLEYIYLWWSLESGCLNWYFFKKEWIKLCSLDSSLNSTRECSWYSSSLYEYGDRDNACPSWFHHLTTAEFNSIVWYYGNNSTFLKNMWFQYQWMFTYKCYHEWRWFYWLDWPNWLWSWKVTDDILRFNPSSVIEVYKERTDANFSFAVRCVKD